MNTETNQSMDIRQSDIDFLKEKSEETLKLLKGLRTSFLILVIAAVVGGFMTVSG